MGFRSVAVIGLGMVGGSFAGAAARRSDAPTIYGIDVDADACALALEMGLVSEAATPDSEQARQWTSAGGVDLVVLATPALVTEQWIRSTRRPRLRRRRHRCRIDQGRRLAGCARPPRRQTPPSWEATPWPARSAAGSAQRAPTCSTARTTPSRRLPRPTWMPIGASTPSCLPWEPGSSRSMLPHTTRRSPSSVTSRMWRLQPSSTSPSPTPGRAMSCCVLRPVASRTQPA